MEFKYGDKGENVKRIQKALNRAGSDLEVDGDFGSLTDKAVREFQEQNNLDVDGIVGRNTLTALGLDPDTLEELSPEPGSRVFDFTQEEGLSILTDPEVLPEVRVKINNYVKLMEEQHDLLLESLQHAINSFDTYMHFSSEEDGDADVSATVLSTLLGAAFDFGVEKLVSKVVQEASKENTMKLISVTKQLFDATSAEIERANEAKESFQLSKWINDQRAIIQNQILKDKNQNTRDLLQAEIEDDFLSRDHDGRQEFLTELNRAYDALKSGASYKQQDLVVKLFEQWINAHFINLAHDGPGCIEYELRFEDGKFDFGHCKVKASDSFDDNANSGLNHLLQDKETSIHLPINLKVRKRVCMEVITADIGIDALGWDCSWLDHNNNILMGPSFQEAKKGMSIDTWRNYMNRFGDY